MKTSRINRRYVKKQITFFIFMMLLIFMIFLKQVTAPGGIPITGNRTYGLNK